VHTLAAKIRATFNNVVIRPYPVQPGLNSDQPPPTGPSNGADHPREAGMSDTKQFAYTILAPKQQKFND
jgi:hypothetical protein